SVLLRQDQAFTGSQVASAREWSTMEATWDAGRIAADLRGQVERRDLSPGQRLPSEADLERRYGVRKTVVRAALATLRDEGIVEIRPRAGTYVRVVDPLEIRWTTLTNLDHHMQVWDGISDQWESAVRQAGHVSTTSHDVRLGVRPPQRVA